MASIGSKDIKLVDFNSSRLIANKYAGEVVDVIGDTEFCGKQCCVKSFNPFTPGDSAVFTVATITLGQIARGYYSSGR